MMVGPLGTDFTRVDSDLVQELLGKGFDGLLSKFRILQGSD
jgi:hypothetical protein